MDFLAAPLGPGTSAAAASFPVQYTVYSMQELDAVSLQSGKFGFKGTVEHISYSFLKGRYNQLL